MSHLLLFEDFEATTAAAATTDKPVRKSRKPAIMDEPVESFGEILHQNEPIEAYHGSPRRFSDFDYRHLGSSKPDVMSMLGIHLSPDKNLSETLFAGRDGFVYTCEVRRGTTLKVDEGAFMRDVVKFGAVHELLGSLNPALLLKLPYYDMLTDKTMVRAMMNAEKRRKFDPRALCEAYVSAKLAPLGIETVEYLNNIEWARDRRYDFAVMNQHNIKITGMERPYGWNL